MLQNAFALAGKTNLKNKNVLLIDGLYRSGATLKAITDILYNIGKVKNVFVFSINKNEELSMIKVFIGGSRNIKQIDRKIKND